MKKIKLYSYTILLLISALVVSPIIFKEIWESSNPKQETVADDPVEDYEPDSESDEQTTTLPIGTDVPLQNGTATNASIENSTDVTTTTTEPAPTFVKGDASYFDDALFVGDSRTVGLSEYGTLKNADYFCDTGMSVYNLNKTKCSIEGIGNVTLETLLSSKQYKKIYFMLGINELWGKYDNNMEKYAGWIDMIKEKQPDAIIFIQANLHVTKARSDSDNTYNNAAIDKFNDGISKLADNKTSFYIDINEVFDDGHGNLPQEFTSDNTHVYAKHYKDWCDWLCTKTIVKE